MDSFLNLFAQIKMKNKVSISEFLNFLVISQNPSSLTAYIVQ